MFPEHVSTLAVTLLFVLSVLGWGGLFSFVAGLIRERFFQRLVAQFILGCGVLYAICLTLGLLGRLHRVEVGIAVGLGVVICCFRLYGLASEAMETFKALAQWNSQDLVLFGFVALLIVLQLLSGLTPLIFYDLYVYHLFVPAQFLLSGTLTHLPWNVHASSPLALQFILGMSLSLDPSGQVAKFLYTALGCLLAVGIYELIRPVGRRAALVSALCVLCYPEFWVMQTLSITDLAAAALMLFGTLWLRESFTNSTSTMRYAILAGTAFGISLGSRYQAVILMAWVVVVLIAEAFLGTPRAKMGSVLKSLCVVGILCIVLVSPWLIRSYVYLGNPVFPLMASTWGLGGEWSAAQAKVLDADIFGPSILSLPVASRLLAPIRLLTDLTRNGPFAMALLFGGLVGIFAKPPIRLVGVLGLGGVILWGIVRPTAGVPLIRFNVLSIVLLLAAAGAIFGSGSIAGRAGPWIALGLAVCSVVVGIQRVQGIIPAAQSLADKNAREFLFRANIPSWEAFAYINTNLDPSRHKLLMIGETRGFGVKVPTIAPSAFNGAQLASLFDGDSGPQEWNAALANRGITHLLLNSEEIERLHAKTGYFVLPPQQARKVNAWISTLHAVFDDHHGGAVLELKP